MPSPVSIENSNKLDVDTILPVLMFEVSNYKLEKKTSKAISSYITAVMIGGK